MARLREATELLLKIILKKNDIIVVSVVGQREFQSPIVGGRNICLDILAKDSTGKYYNVEVQKKPEGAHIHRARFNSSMMDSRMLKAGQEFSENSVSVVFSAVYPISSMCLSAIWSADRRNISHLYRFGYSLNR